MQNCNGYETKGGFSMNTQKYKAFVEAVRHKNLTSAARALHYTQPGLSRMISSLEDELGFPLLFRTKNGVFPTDAGREIYMCATQIIEMETALEQIVAQINGVITGKLRITSYLGELVGWLPNVIEIFAKDYPDVEFFLFEGEFDEQISMLKHNLADIAIFCGPVPDGFLFVPLHVDPAVVLIPDGHELLEKETIYPEDLLRYPIIMQHESSAEETRNVFQDTPGPISGKYTVKSDSTIVALVQKGLGIGLTSAIIVTPPPPSVVVRHLDKPYARTIGLLVSQQKAHLPAVKRFIEIMRELYQDAEFK